MLDYKRKNKTTLNIYIYVFYEEETFVADLIFRICWKQNHKKSLYIEIRREKKTKKKATKFFLLNNILFCIHSRVKQTLNE